MTAYDFNATALDGQPVDLARYRGKALLIVNTASACGFTPQYQGLEELQRRYADQGLVVLGFPCNQFGHQEPGSEVERLQQPFIKLATLPNDIRFELHARPKRLYFSECQNSLLIQRNQDSI